MKVKIIHCTLTRERFRGCLLGLATGDAVGTTLEFRPRGTFDPIDDMVGGGPFDLKPGEWTDDTSMALCLATSLVELQGFNPRDQMERYCRWRDEGYLGSNGHCFDIGSTVAAALDKFQRTDDPFAGSSDSRSAGNGAIMRLAPVAMYYSNDSAAVSTFAAESARTTHGAIECVDACRLLGGILERALAGGDKAQVLFSDSEFEGAASITSIARGDYRMKQSTEILGSGYVVESLEAALWCFWSTTSFREAILKAANLGDDADTTAAVCGQVAGAYYGRPGIPSKWLGKLAKREEIFQLADRLYTHATAHRHE